MAYERLLDKTTQPTHKEMLNVTGNAGPSWQLLTKELATRYDVEPECRFGGKKYGWQLKYRRGGRTLCGLYPEQGALTALVVLGRKETDKAMAQLDQLPADVRTTLLETEPYHDGRWLWIRVHTLEDAQSVLLLVACKRRPLVRKETWRSA